MTEIVQIALENIKKSYFLGTQTLNILEDLSLKVEKGQHIAILGESGAGKSTLLSLLAGLDKPDSGEIRITDKRLAQMSYSELEKFRQSTIGFIFQGFHLIPYLTALENTTLPLEIKGDKDYKAKGEAILKELGMAERLNHFPKELSGGEQQRVAIARAAVTNPQIILADEPTGNLDQKTGGKVMDYLFNLCRQTNITLVIVTHSHKLARRCQRAYYLDKGFLQPLKTGELT